MQHHLAFITGASSGIGLSLCQLLARQGLHLILSGRDVNQLQKLSQSLPEGCVVEMLAVDLAQAEGRLKAIELIHRLTPDLVINNAGCALYGEALTYSLVEQEALLQINGVAVLELTLEAARALRSKGQKGVVMNISSVVSFFIYPSFAVYAAAKAFINQFSESFDLEMQRHGIRILVNCPGIVKTPFNQRAGVVNPDIPVQFRSIAMNADEVAEKIWNQIQTQKSLWIVNWKYRLFTSLSYCLPKRWLAYLLQKNIEELIAPRNFKDISQ